MSRLGPVREYSKQVEVDTRALAAEKTRSCLERQLADECIRAWRDTLAQRTETEKEQDAYAAVQDAEVGRLRNEVDARDRQLADMQMTIDARERQLADMHVLDEAREQRLADLQRTVEGQNRQIADLQTALNEGDEKYGQLLDQFQRQQNAGLTAPEKEQLARLMAKHLHM